MSPVYLRDLGFQRNQPEDRGGNINPAIHTSIQQEPQTRGVEGYGSSSSAPPTPQSIFSIEHGQKEVQPGISLGRTWSKLPEDLSQRGILQIPYDNHQKLESYQTVQTPEGKVTEDKGESSHYPSYRRTVNPDRVYSDSFRITRRRPNQLSSGFTPFRHQQINDQESPLFTIPGGFQAKKRIQGEKQDLFQPKAERIRLHDPEVVGLGERSLQEPEGVVNHSRISSTSNRNITPTQTEHNIVTSESNINSDML
ncbi:hypothetical protein O181_057210 [Austropuccinia psidii MF-1]|uniref:Uncharacterized protein n=1 Tax=Austropuccinia psidii MF-1 TaxID=1389203 RepID=A0A9Q3HWT0_9BASI|nr:hypothetical protein [Austropuccinia psidii MF-1]